jgi:flagellar biosynthesis anti-sigma factor FlgM
MSHRRYDTSDTPGQSHAALPEKQGRGQRIATRKGKRPGVRRKALSRHEKELQRLRKIVEQAPAVREDRVAAAKKALQAGGLELRGEKLAEKLLHEFLHRSTPEA